MHRFLRLALSLAKNHQYDPSLEFNLCAVIVRGGKVLSVGYNHRYWNGLTEHYKTTDHCCTTHAEIDAILLKRKKVRFEGAKIYVLRLKANGTVGHAKPCEMCEKVLRAYGFKRMTYTIADDEYGVKKLG